MRKCKYCNAEEELRDGMCWDCEYLADHSSAAQRFLTDHGIKEKWLQKKVAATMLARIDLVLSRLVEDE